MPRARQLSRQRQLLDNVRFREFRSTCSARQYGIQGNWHQRYPFEPRSLSVSFFLPLLVRTHLGSVLVS